MDNTTDQFTYLTFPPEAIHLMDRDLPEMTDAMVPEAIRFFRDQFGNMNRPELAEEMDRQAGSATLRKFSTVISNRGTPVGVRVPFQVQWGEWAGWNPATQTYEIRQGAA